MENAIVVENVSKTFPLNKNKGITSILKKFSSTDKSSDFLKVLDEISFSIPKGEVVALIGANGSGKTTLLRIISGIYKADSGNITINGTLSPLLQIGIGFNNEMNAKENIIINCLLLGLSKSEASKKVNDILDYSGLKKFENSKLKHLSAGMRARLGFAISTQIHSDILLVDEVLAVGDVSFRRKCFAAFSLLRKNKKTVIFTSHNTGLVSKLSDRVIFLNDGKIEKIGPPSEVIPIYNEMMEKEKRKNL